MEEKKNNSNSNKIDDKIKNTKKLKIILIIILLITLFFIISTYARYFQEVDTNYDMNLKRWNIKLNTKEIQNEKELTKIIQPVLIPNENIKDGIIAPGREGYFQFQIDFTEVDVPFETKVQIKPNNKEALLDFEFYKYSIVENGVEKEQKTTDILLITDAEKEKKEGKTKKDIKVYFRWNDDENNKMDDYKDTIYQGEANTNGGKNTVLDYIVTLDFSQHIK